MSDWVPAPLPFRILQFSPIFYMDERRVTKVIQRLKKGHIVNTIFFFLILYFSLLHFPSFPSSLSSKLSKKMKASSTGEDQSFFFSSSPSVTLNTTTRNNFFSYIQFFWAYNGPHSSLGKMFWLCVFHRLGSTTSGDNRF